MKINFPLIKLLNYDLSCVLFFLEYLRSFYIASAFVQHDGWFNTSSSCRNVSARLDLCVLGKPSTWNLHPSWPTNAFLLFACSWLCRQVCSAKMCPRRARHTCSFLIYVMSTKTHFHSEPSASVSCCRSCRNDLSFAYASRSFETPHFCNFSSDWWRYYVESISNIVPSISSWYTYRLPCHIFFLQQSTHFIATLCSCSSFASWVRLATAINIYYVHFVRLSASLTWTACNLVHFVFPYTRHLLNFFCVDCLRICLRFHYF